MANTSFQLYCVWVFFFFNLDREYFSVPLGRQGSCPSYMFFFKKDKVSGDRENLIHCRMCAVHAQSLSPVQFFVIPRTIAHQVPLSMGLPRQEFWSGSHFLLQGIFLTQGSNPHLLHWQANSLPLSQSMITNAYCSTLKSSVSGKGRIKQLNIRVS